MDEPKRIGRVIKTKRKLLRCPFCGGAPELVRWHQNGEITVFVRCENCGCGTEKWHITPFTLSEEEASDAAAKMWNRRRA